MDQSDGRCAVHSFEPAEARCRDCGHEFCNECLVYAFGPAKPPFCVSCALAAAGVRANAGRRPAMSRREIRRIEKERRRAEKHLAETAPRVEADPAAWTAAASEQAGDPFAWVAQTGDRVPH